MPANANSAEIDSPKALARLAGVGRPSSCSWHSINSEMTTQSRTAFPTGLIPVDPLENGGISIQEIHDTTYFGHGRHRLFRVGPLRTVAGRGTSGSCLRQPHVESSFAFPSVCQS